MAEVLIKTRGRSCSGAALIASCRVPQNPCTSLLGGDAAHASVSADDVQGWWHEGESTVPMQFGWSSEGNSCPHHYLAGDAHARALDLRFDGLRPPRAYGLACNRAPRHASITVG